MHNSKNIKVFYFFCFILSRIFFSATAKPNCKGIAGVNGADQNAIYEPNTVHHHGDITHAKTAETIQGDQNISSAIITHNSISRFITCLRSHCHAFLIRSFILFVRETGGFPLTKSINQRFLHIFTDL